ncbi:MAG: hypothetical protein M3N25_05965 [Actinomycetota bacterium]|nr:hypothetical protein [Actinomycetota bacterium]
MTLEQHSRFAPAEGLSPEAGPACDFATTTVRTPRAVPAILAAAMLMVVLSACGGVDDEDSESKAPPETPSTTTSAPQEQPSNTVTTTAGTSCLELAAEARQLAQDARGTMRGIAGPSPEDEAELQARGEALLAEARRLGCPVPPGLSADYVREPGL